MGSCQTKDKKASGQSERVVVEGLKSKVRLLQGEINEIMCIREAERQTYQREVMAFALKEAEWKRDRKRLKEEVRKLRKLLEENRDGLGTRSTRKACRVNQEEEEEEMMAGRDETVEKWKQLYFAIKVELDHLIQRTRQEERLCWNSEEELLMELQKELKDSEGRIEHLQQKLASMEHQEYKREREMDILRQSLRIVSHSKRAPRATKGRQSLWLKEVTIETGSKFN